MDVQRVVLIRDRRWPGYATDEQGGKWATVSTTQGDEQVLQPCDGCGQERPWVWRHTGGAQLCASCVEVR